MKIANGVVRTTSFTEACRLLTYRYKDSMTGRWWHLYPLERIDFSGEPGNLRWEFVLRDRFGDAAVIAYKRVKDVGHYYDAHRFLRKKLAEAQQVQMFPDFQRSNAAAA